MKINKKIFGLGTFFLLCQLSIVPQYFTATASEDEEPTQYNERGTILEEGDNYYEKGRSEETEPEAEEAEDSESEEGRSDN